MRGWVFNYLMDFVSGLGASVEAFSVSWAFGVCVKRRRHTCTLGMLSCRDPSHLRLNNGGVWWCEVEVHNRIGRSPSNALPRVVQVQTRSRRLVDARWTPAKVHSVQVTRAHLCPEWGSWSVRMWELECQYIGIGVGHSTRYVCID